MKKEDCAKKMKYDSKLDKKADKKMSKLNKYAKKDEE